LTLTFRLPLLIPSVPGSRSTHVSLVAS
jgi:hypothetical protein